MPGAPRVWAAVAAAAARGLNCRFTSYSSIFDRANEIWERARVMLVRLLIKVQDDRNVSAIAEPAGDFGRDNKR